MATNGDSGTSYARAKFAFVGKNNDEVSLLPRAATILQLCLGKDDIVTLTQTIDGGWWEGTLGEKTGWFPADFVVRVDENESFLRIRSKSPATGRNVELSTAVTPSNRADNRAAILNTLLDDETRHVSELTHVHDALLLTLGDANAYVSHRRCSPSQIADGRL